jgi:hypothetical protein
LTGGIFIVVVMLFRKGIVGQVNELLRRRRTPAPGLPTMHRQETAK